MSGALKAYLRPWLCVGALFISQLVVAVLALAGCVLSPGFAYWMLSPWGVFSITAIGGAVALAVIWLFLRPPSVGEFFGQLGLRFPPRGIRISLIVLGVALGFAGNYLGSKFLTWEAVKSTFMKAYTNGSFEGAYLFAIGLVVRPFFDELVMRGFLYQSFRKSYGLWASLAVILLLATLGQWRSATASIWFFLFFALLEITLCVIYEKTKNLWNCIALHVAYNAVIAYFFLKAMFP